MNDTKLVWSDEKGDLRKKKEGALEGAVNEAAIILELRRLTSGKGRTIIEVKGLPNNKNWCKKLAKDLKQSLGVGGAFKNGFIEVHGEKMNEVMAVLEKRSLKYKKTGG